MVQRRVAGSAPYLARLTPYACVVAELQGAKFDIVATYSSRATREKNSLNPALTYHSYFVVNPAASKYSFSEIPTLREINDFLQASSRSFLYHDKFSASSYFIPLNHFRSQRIISSRVDNLRDP